MDVSSHQHKVRDVSPLQLTKYPMPERLAKSISVPLLIVD